MMLESVTSCARQVPAFEELGANSVTARSPLSLNCTKCAPDGCRGNNPCPLLAAGSTRMMLKAFMNDLYLRYIDLQMQGGSRGIEFCRPRASGSPSATMQGGRRSNTACSPPPVCETSEKQIA